MKKLSITLLVLFSTLAYSQNAFMVYEFEAKRGCQDAILELADGFWGEANFKSGGIDIERMEIGGEPSTHRIVLYGDPANWGRSDTTVTKAQWEAFIEKFQNFVEEWTFSTSGEILNWVGSDDNDAYQYGHIYDFKAEDEEAFKAAHEKLVGELSSEMDGRDIGFGSILINGYEGSTHWVYVGAKNWTDLVQNRRDMKAKTKEFEEYYNTRGGVEYVRNFTIEILRSY